MCCIHCWHMLAIVWSGTANLYIKLWLFPKIDKSELHRDDLILYWPEKIMTNLFHRTHKDNFAIRSSLCERSHGVRARIWGDASQTHCVIEPKGSFSFKLIWAFSAGSLLCFWEWRGADAGRRVQGAHLNFTQMLWEKTWRRNLQDLEEGTCFSRRANVCPLEFWQFIS